MKWSAQTGGQWPLSIICKTCQTTILPFSISVSGAGGASSVLFLDPGGVYMHGHFIY